MFPMQPFARRAAVVVLPLSLIALVACDPPGRAPIEIVQRPPEAPAEVIPAGGLTPAPTGTPAPAPRLATPATAGEAYRAGNYADAKALYTAVVGATPSDGFSQYMLGLATWKAGDPAGALKAFDAALKVDPTHLKSYLNSARVLLDLGRHQEALERAEAALALDSTAGETVRVVARAHASLGHVDAAIDTYRRALVIDDTDLWSLNNLGMLYIELGDPDAALGPLARAVQLRATSPVFQNNLGMALELDGYPLAAREAYEAAVRADSSYRKAVANLERISKVTPEGTVEPGLSLTKVADLFRLEVGMWRDSARALRPDPDSVPAILDSLPPQ